MDLSRMFSDAVITALKAREQKALAISEGIESFIQWAIESHKNHEMSSETVGGIPRGAQYLANLDNDDDDAQTHFLTFYCDIPDTSLDAQSSIKCSTELSISTYSSGLIRVGFVGQEYGEEGAEELFSSDTYSVEETVAKIISVIQYHDINDFGPFVTEAVRRMSTDGVNYKGVPTPARTPEGF